VVEIDLKAIKGHTLLSSSRGHLAKRYVLSWRFTTFKVL